MIGLGLGTGFLAGFGAGPMILIVWLGIGSILLARRSVGVLPVIAIGLTIGGGVWFAHHSSDHRMAAIPPGDFEGMVEIVDGPFLTQAGQRFSMIPTQYPDSRLCAYAGHTPRPSTGDRVFLSGTITSFEDLSDIGRAATRIRACDAQLRIDSMQVVAPGTGFGTHIARLRVRFSTFLMRAAPGDTGALMSGLVTGDDGGLSRDASRAFLTSGTTHITAISGANFATLLILLGVFATGAMRRNILFVIAGSGAIWLYGFMVGLEPSALRAALLATAVLIGRWLGRRPDLLTLTVLLAAVQIALRPGDFRTLGFQLSLAATLALIVVFDGSERNERNSWPTTLISSVFAAQLATIPILAWTVGTVNGVGLLANLVVGPIAGIAFPIAFVGAAVGAAVPFVGEIILIPAMVMCRMMILLVEYCDRVFPGVVQLGSPTMAAMATITAICWVWIFWLSGDLRRMTRHGFSIIQSW